MGDGRSKGISMSYRHNFHVHVCMRACVRGVRFTLSFLPKIFL